jgi:hypothetical protein
VPLAHEDTDALTIRDALEAVPDLLPQIGAHPAPAEVAHTAAVLVARATAPLVAAAVEWAIVAEAIVGAIHGLSARAYPAKCGGVVQAQDGVPAGAAEGDASMVGLGRAGADQGEQGGGSACGRRLESLAA